MKNWKTSAEAILTTGPVVPVIVVNKLEHAVPMAKALVAGGVRVLEVTLRTACAMDAIRAIAKEVPEAIIGRYGSECAAAGGSDRSGRTVCHQPGADRAPAESRNRRFYSADPGYQHRF